MSVQLPKEMNYAEPMSALPPTTRTVRMVISPSNVSNAADNQQIIFDLPDNQNGYIVPGSLKISYKCRMISSAVAATVRGVPAYTFFQRCETFVQQGSQLIEGINQYGSLCDKLYATKLTASQKLGNAFSLGILNRSTTPTAVNLTGRTNLAADETWTMSAPLGCILSNAEKLVPARCGFRIVLTTDTLGNIAAGAGAETMTSFNLTNLEVAYDMVEFSSPEMEAVVQELSTDGQISIKSQSYSLTSQSLAASANGSQTLTFNNRFSSIKSLLAFFGGSGNQVNGPYYDSVDITQNTAGRNASPPTGGGSYVFEIGGKMYPERPLSTANGKSAVYSALADCWGGNSHSLYNESMSILPIEFDMVENSATDAALPGRFYFGQNVEKLNGSSAMFSGVSSNDTTINLRVELPQATTRTHQVSLICLYDSILTIDLNSKQASVRV